MNKSITILIKGLILLKSVLSILFLISVVALGFEWYFSSSSIHPESNYFTKETPKEIASMLPILFVLITTLLFDIRTLKLKNETIYKQWITLLLLTILVIAVSFIFKIHWLGITLMIILGFYSLFLLFKFQRHKSIR